MRESRTGSVAPAAEEKGETRAAAAQSVSEDIVPRIRVAVWHIFDRLLALRPEVLGHTMALKRQSNEPLSPHAEVPTGDGDTEVHLGDAAAMSSSGSVSSLGSNNSSRRISSSRKISSLRVGVDGLTQGDLDMLIQADRDKREGQAVHELVAVTVRSGLPDAFGPVPPTLPAAQKYARQQVAGDDKLWKAFLGRHPFARATPLQKHLSTSRAMSSSSFGNMDVAELYDSLHMLMGRRLAPPASTDENVDLTRHTLGSEVTR